MRDDEGNVADESARLMIVMLMLGLSARMFLTVAAPTLPLA